MGTFWSESTSRSKTRKMKVFASLIVATMAQQDGVESNGWIANPDAPHCGCQILLDTATIGQTWNYINQTCSLSFKYPGLYSPIANVDPHFVSVASSYMVGREKSGSGASKFKFTGYDEVSNAAQLDILVFYEQNDCFRDGSDGMNTNFSAIDQSTIWEYYNMTSQQQADLCAFELTCDDTGAVPGVHLGNFNYDIARSVQTYTVPIYGLDEDSEATFTIVDYNGDPNNCMNAEAHHGHGTASGSQPTPPLAARMFSHSSMIKAIKDSWSTSNSSPSRRPTTQSASPCPFITSMITTGRRRHHGTRNKPMPMPIPNHLSY